MKTRAVFDTSPLIFTDHLGYIPRLGEFFEVIITPDVAAELSVPGDKAGSKVASLPWVREQVPEQSFVQTVQQESYLGRGETSVLALGLQLALPVVLDDFAARRFASQKGLGLTGTLGILLKFHLEKVTTRSLEQDLQMLSEFGMFVSEELKSYLIGQLNH